MCEFLIFNTQKRYEKQKNFGNFWQLFGNSATFRQLFEKNSNFLATFRHFYQQLFWDSSDMDWYENECLRLLNDTQFYGTILRKNGQGHFSTHSRMVKKYISRLQFDHMIDDESAKYLKENSPKPGRFYTIPKIHKQGNPGRPIVSSNSDPTERISQFVDHHLQPLVTKLPSYIKDTTHFLNKLNNIGQLPNGVLLVTLNVTSLYTNIPHKDGIQACSDFLDRRTNPTFKTTRFCDLIRLILTLSPLIDNTIDK